MSRQQFSVTRSCRGLVKSVADSIALSTYSSPRTFLLAAIPSRYFFEFISSLPLLMCFVPNPAGHGWVLLRIVGE